MASGTFVKFHASHQVVVNLLVLLATLVLPIAGVRLLKLQKQSATNVLPSCACHLAHSISTKAAVQELYVWDS